MTVLKDLESIRGYRNEKTANNSYCIKQSLECLELKNTNTTCIDFQVNFKCLELNNSISLDPNSNLLKCNKNIGIDQNIIRDKLSPKEIISKLE